MKEKETRILKMSDDFSIVENSPLWRREIPCEDVFGDEYYVEIDIYLDCNQYESMKRGYTPTSDFPYELHYINGWFYFSHSGLWVQKIRFDKIWRGYCLSECYSTEFEWGHPLLAESFCKANYDSQIWTEEDAKKYWYEYRKKVLLPYPVMSKPEKCKHCGHTEFKEYVYGLRRADAVLRDDQVAGGCVYNTERSPDYICTNCGTTFKILSKDKMIKRTDGMALSSLYSTNRQLCYQWIRLLD